MTYCAVGGCSNKSNRDVSKREGRNFLKYHNVPKDPDIRGAWDRRLNRDWDQVKNLALYRVCSDHFEDCDYDSSDFLRVKMMGYSGRQKLELLNDAIPNTDRSTGQASYFQSNQSGRYLGIII